VADHRRHHAFSDVEGDPHSPWRYGNSVWGLTKGMFHAHLGWMFHRELSNRDRFAPDLVADRDISRVDKLFPVFVAASLLAPALTRRLLEDFTRRPPPGQSSSQVLDELTERELEILRLMAQGLANPDIAEAVHVSLSTVKRHLERINHKLGVSDRTQAVVRAFEEGLVPDQQG
jgi:DNA-binding CsgD family transcriptional regulator